jgi:hypothetical protein
MRWGVRLAFVVWLLVANEVVRSEEGDGNLNRRVGVGS